MEQTTPSLRPEQREAAAAVADAFAHLIGAVGAHVILHNHELRVESGVPFDYVVDVKYLSGQPLVRDAVECVLDAVTAQALLLPQQLKASSVSPRVRRSTPRMKLSGKRG